MLRAPAIIYPSRFEAPRAAPDVVVYADSWHREPVLPVRRKWTPLGRGLVTVDAIDTSSPHVSGWGQPLSDPTRRKWSPLGRWPVTVDRIDTSHPNIDAWLAPLSLPTRRKWTPLGRGATIDRIDPATAVEEILADKWLVPWLPPTLRVTRRLGEKIDAIDTRHPNIDAWLQSLSYPVLRKWSPNVRGAPTIIGVDETTFAVPVVPDGAWFHPLSLPTRRLWSPLGRGITVDRIDPIATPAPALAWFHPLSIPTRRITRRYGIILDRIDPTTVPAVLASHWYRWLSEPRRFARDPRASIVLAVTSGGIWVTTGAYEPGPDEILLSDQFAEYVYTAEIHPWATGHE
jgi:hypothetical protein